MNNIHLTTTKLLGPPLLSWIAAAVAIGAGLVFILLVVNVASMGAMGLAMIVACRLSQLGVRIDAADVVVNNFFSTKRIPLTTAVVSQNQSGVRSRTTVWGSHVANGPKLSDDNSATRSRIMFIGDSSDAEFSIQIDAGFGRVPSDFDAAFERLGAGVASAQGND